MFQGAYPWTNFPILALGVWAVAQRDSVDAISMVSWGSSQGTGFRVVVGPAPSSPSTCPVFSGFFFPHFPFSRV